MNPKDKSIFPLSFEITWSLFTAFVVIITSTLILHYLFTIFAFMVVILEIIVVQQSTKGLTFQITSYIALGILIILLYSTFTNELKHGNNAHFEDIRLKAFKEYTEFKMFGYKAQPWQRKDLGNYQPDDLKTKSILISSNTNVRSFKFATLGQRIISLFKPFILSSTNFPESPDCVYFPQRLLATLLVTLFAYIIISIQTAEFTYSLLNK